MDLVCVSHSRKEITFYDPYTLMEVEEMGFSGRRAHSRLVQVFSEEYRHHTDSICPLIAVSDGTTYGCTKVYDLSGRRKCIAQLPTFGPAIETIPESYCSDCAMVVAANHDGVFVFRALSGHKVFIFPNAPRKPERLLCVPGWSYSDVYVAGTDYVARYDLNWEGDRIGSYLRRSTKSGVYPHRTKKSGATKSGGCPPRTKKSVALPVFRSSVAVSGLAADVDRKVLISGSMEREVRLWSRDEYSLVESIEVSGPVRSLYYAGDLNLLLVGCVNSLEMFDPRNLSSRVSLAQIRPSARSREEGINDIDRVDHKLFVLVSGPPGKVHLVNARTHTMCTEAVVTPGAGWAPTCLGVRYLRKSSRDSTEERRIAVADSSRLLFAMHTDTTLSLRFFLVELRCWKSLID